MARGVKIEGTDRLQALAVQLKAADKVMLAGLRVQLKAVAAATIPAVRESAIEGLPSSGGLNERVARAPYRATMNLGTKSATVSVRGKQGNRHLKDINNGQVRHPLFGNREHWYTTPVKPGFFNTPLERMAPAVRIRMQDVMYATEVEMGFK